MAEHPLVISSVIHNRAWGVAVCRARMEKEELNPDNMIQPEDVCQLVLLPFKVSANAVPQEVVLDAMKNPSA